LALLDVLDQLK